MHFPEPRPRNDEERILPLINVVFLLLIFFMLAGRLAASDPFQVSPPSSISEGEAAGQELLVLVGAEGQLALDNREVAAEELRAAVSRRMEQDAGAPVRLKADGAAEATRVVEVMELLREAGAERLKLLTLPQESGG